MSQKLTLDNLQENIELSNHEWDYRPIGSTSNHPPALHLLSFKSVPVRLLFILVFMGGMDLSAPKAQNWQPIHANQVYYYQADSGDHMTHQLQVDSTYIRNGHRVQLLNTGLQRCDTCSTDNLPVVGETRDIDTVYYQTNHPFFWQRKVVDSQNRYYFYGNRDFILAPEAPKDTPWQFRLDTSVMARIDSVYRTSVFGRSDSVKRIRINGNQTLLLTKNHGILAFPPVQDSNHYQLTGISGAKRVGKTFGFKDIYDFHVGDVFQYEASGGIDPQQGYENTISRYRITNKTSSGDTLIYTATYKRLINFGRVKDLKPGTTRLKFYPGGRLPFNSRYERLGYDQANRFPGEVLTQFGLKERHPLPKFEDLATSCRLKVDSNDRLTKTMGGPRRRSEPMNFYMQAKNSIYLAQSHIEAQYEKRFKEGLGITFHNQFHFESHSYRKLMGYVKGGDTVGTIFSDSTFREKATGVPHTDHPTVKVYPNPVQRTLYLEKLSPAQAAEIRLYNQMGQLVSQQRQSGAEGRINMEGLDPGLYILKVRDGGDGILRKVVKR